MSRIGATALLVLAATSIAVGGRSDTVRTPGQPGPATSVWSAVSVHHAKPLVVAAGRVQALSEIVIGGEASGRITRVLADVNQSVTDGQLLALIDDTEAKHLLRRAEAAVAMATAELMKAKADAERIRLERQLAENSRDEAGAALREAQTRLREAESQARRTRALGERGVASGERLERVELELASRGAFKEAATARLQGTSLKIALTESQIKMADAAVDVAQAVLDQRIAECDAARVVLARTRVHAPTSGIILARRIEEGQTIAARMETPELFVMAPSLDQIKVIASISEADVAKLRGNVRARFRVEALRDRYFELKIDQLRPYPKRHDAVVVYEVVLVGANPERHLLPGMTSIVEFMPAGEQELVSVPAGAIRWSALASDAVETPGAQVTKRRPDGPTAVIAVEVVSTKNGQAMVRSGDLQAGDLVLVDLQMTQVTARNE